MQHPHTFINETFRDSLWDICIVMLFNVFWNIINKILSRKGLINTD